MDRLSFQEYADSLTTKLRLGSINKKIVAGCAGVLLLLIASSCFLLFGNTEISVAGTSDEENPSIIVENNSSESAQPSQIYVHVAGCVNNPGVYSLDEGSRVGDAVLLAGGTTEEAASDSINLARVVEDGEQIIIPGKASLEAQSQSASQESKSNGEGVAAASQNNAGKVNINAASSSELQTISGIGASKAQKIIAYRESNGKFKSVDDLLSVSGIGEKTLESIRDSICV